MQTAISPTSARLASSQGWSASNDHRLPGHEQDDSEPKQTMDQRCEPGGNGRACGESQAAGQRGTDEHQEQCHIGAPTRTCAGRQSS